MKSEKNDMSEARSTYRGEGRRMVGKPEGRRPLGLPRRIWEDNIKVDLQEARWGQEDIDTVQDTNK